MKWMSYTNDNSTGIYLSICTLQSRIGIRLFIRDAFNSQTNK